MHAKRPIGETKHSSVKDEDEESKAKRHHPESSPSSSDVGESSLTANEYYKKSLAYETGTDEVRQSNEHFLLNLKAAADQGHAVAQYRISRVYRRGLGLHPNQEEAKRYCMQAAKQNYLPAVGICYDFGYGLKQDEKKALEIYMKAHTEGDLFGTWNVAYSHEDKATAFGVLMFGVASGHLDCICTAGLFWERGWGIARDYVQAFNMFQMAAARGDVHAYWCLGSAYSRGRGVTANPSLAFRWSWRAAQQNHAAAQLEVGFAYLYGRADPENVIDVEAGIKWLRKSAANGKRQAQAFLGKVYEFGSAQFKLRDVERADPDFEVQVDLRKAVEFYRVDEKFDATNVDAIYLRHAAAELKRLSRENPL